MTKSSNWNKPVRKQERNQFPLPNENPSRAPGKKHPNLGFLFLCFVTALIYSAPISSFCQTTETPTAVAEAIVDLPIPDGNTEGVGHTITISGSEALESLEVALQIDHPATDELIVSLTGPLGNRIVLHNRTYSAQTPFSPIYETVTPSAESLKSFLGTNPQGAWTISIADVVEGNTGTFLSWGLRVKPGSLIQPLPPAPVPIPENLYTTAAELIVEATPSGGAAGDANNDGLDDLFLLSEQGNRISVFFSNGSVFTEPPLQYNSENPQQIVLADFNKDGNLDFAVASQTENIALTTITVFLANIAGGFSQGFTAQISTSLDRLAAFDATGDGNTDLIVGGVPQLIEGVGDGSFKPAVQLVHLGQSYQAHGDLNGDGLADILVTVSRGGTSPNADPYVLFGNQDLTFPWRQKISIDWPIVDAASGSLNEAGISELNLITQIASDPITYEIHSIRENAFYQVETTHTQASGEILETPVVSKDLNGDGLNELIYTTANGVYAFQKGFNAASHRTTLIFEHPSTQKVVLGNFFSDASLGAAAIDSSTTVTLIHSSIGPLPTPTPYATPTPSPTPFLFPTVAQATPTSIPPSPTPTPVAPTKGSPDINGDGVVDRLDLLILLEYWGQRVQ